MRCHIMIGHYTVVDAEVSVDNGYTVVFPLSSNLELAQMFGRWHEGLRVQALIDGQPVDLVLDAFDEAGGRWGLVEYRDDPEG